RVDGPAAARACRRGFQQPVPRLTHRHGRTAIAFFPAAVMGCLMSVLRISPIAVPPAGVARTHALACAVAFALSSAALAAQPADEATTLDAVQVIAPIPKDTGVATKTDTPLAEVPQSISVITAWQMQDRAVHGVEE